MNEPTLFLIVSAGRTGSNLLRSLLDSHPDVFCGGEIFNKEFVASAGVPWPLGGVEADMGLRSLMLDDPAEYFRRLVRVAAEAGKKVIGAKLTYENGAAHPAAAGFLAGLGQLRVIHLQRRNLLRQYLSLQRAFKTGKWSQQGGASAPPPPVTIDVVHCVWYYLRNKELATKADQVFGAHPRFDITYEALSADPQGVARQCLGFLGASSGANLLSSHKKSGTDDLRSAIANHDALKAQFAEWSGFFDD